MSKIRIAIREGYLSEQKRRSLLIYGCLDIQKVLEEISEEEN